MIDIFLGEEEIWGINSYRQLFYLPVDLKQEERGEVTMKYYRDIANVQRLLVGDNYKLCIKTVKRPAIYKEVRVNVPELSEICVDHITERLVILLFNCRHYKTLLTIGK